MDEKAAVDSIARFLAKSEGPGTARMMETFLENNQDFDPAESGYAPADGIAPDNALVLMEIARACWQFVCNNSGPIINYTAAAITIYEFLSRLISRKSDMSEEEAKEIISKGLKKASELTHDSNDSETNPK